MPDHAAAASSGTVTQDADHPGLPDLEKAQEDFARFYAEHRSGALIALRLELSGTGIDPDDIASRMWVRIWQMWRKRGPIVEEPRAFVRQCARNAAFDALRTKTDLLVEVENLDSMAARQRADCDNASSPEREQLKPSGPEWDAEEELLTNPELIAAVEELTFTQRQVVLTWIETFPPPTSEQIARILNIPSASTVRVHRMRAIKKLRNIIKPSAMVTPPTLTDR